MDASIGPEIIQQNYVDWNSFKLVKDLTQISSKLIFEDLNPQYFIKLSSKSSRCLQTSIDFAHGNGSFLMGLSSLMEGSWTNLVNPGLNYILKDSIVHKYLFEMDPTNEYLVVKNDIVRKSKAKPVFYVLLSLYSAPILVIISLYLGWKLMKTKKNKNHYK